MSNNLMQFTAEYMMITQMGMKAGIKAFSKEGVNVVVKEMKQFHDREVVHPLDMDKVTSAIRWQSHTYLIFKKRKRMGT